jgi:hypothetical protein
MFENDMDRSWVGAMNTLIVKRVAWMIGTTAPIYLMLTVFMPPGFGGVPWMWLVLLVFAGLFIGLLCFERSALWNGIIAFVFWIPMVIIHIMHPGTQTVAEGKVYVGVLQIFGIAAIHGGLQFGARFLVNYLARMDANEPIEETLEEVPNG